MSNIKAIRERLKVTQAALAEGMGCTQGNVGHYEKGQTVPPDAAKRLIAYALTLGQTVTYEQIYGEPVSPKKAPKSTDLAHGAASIEKRAKKKQRREGPSRERKEARRFNPAKPRSAKNNPRQRATDKERANG